MFDQLSETLLKSIKKFKGQARISEDNIQDVLREIKLALLEADVHFHIVKKFIERVKTKAIGAQVTQGVNPGEQFVKFVYDELVNLLGGGSSNLQLGKVPSIVMLVGLQGMGKTTTCGKLGLYIRKSIKKKPGLVPIDIYRPAAIDQLKILGKQNDLPVFHTESNQSIKKIAKLAKKWAKENMIEVLLFDTAGRLQIDNELMNELSDLKSYLNPDEILLVADAMLGQQSVNIAEGFHQKLNLTGLILTKVDGDARGGAALSIREMTGVPIKFLGVGEQATALETFYPDRLASRILDRGDVVSLVERAQEVIDESKAQKIAKKVARNEFTVEDFLGQIKSIKKMGSMESILKMLPGMSQISKQMRQMSPPDAELKKIEAIISSMTLKERRNYKILNGSRRLRIANGSGTQVKDVNQFIKKFEYTKKMMSQMMKSPLGQAGFNPFKGSPF